MRAQASIGGRARSVIIKATRALDYAPSSAAAFSDSGLVREWVARALFGQSETLRPLSLLAGDAEHGLIVFDDLGADLVSMATRLIDGPAADAEGALAAYAASLGLLHAATIGCAQRHAVMLRGTFPAAKVPENMGVDWLAAPVPELAGQGLPEDELDVVRARISDPGPWLALVHGDGCPDNVLLAGDKAWLLDFEFSAPGHALLDAAYWRIGFPTCWCAGATPEPIADRIEAVYRRELAVGVPEAADDEAFQAEMAIASVARLLFSLRWLLNGALAQDSVWGIATRRSRILWYLQAARAACAKAEHFAGTRVVLTDWLDQLRERWPASELLALYPAFAQGDRGRSPIL